MSLSIIIIPKLEALLWEGGAVRFETFLDGFERIR